MAETKNLNVRIQLKYDSYARWEAVKDTFVPKKGEVCFVEVPASTDAVKQEPALLFKVGDGVKTFGALPYGSAKAADVSSWALAATKPTYAATEIKGIDTYIAKYVNESMGISVDTDTQYTITKVNDYQYKLMSKSKADTDYTGEVAIIDIPKYDDAGVKANIAALQGLVGSTAVATQIANAIDALNLANTYEAKGAADDVKNEIIGSDTDTDASATIAGAKKYADKLDAAMDARVDTLETAIGEGGSVGAQIDAKIQALDVTDTAVTGKYVSSVSEVDGKIEVTRENLPDYTNVYEPKGAGATEAGKVQTALNVEIERAKAAENANATAAANAQSTADAAQSDVDALEAKVGTVADGKTVVEMIADAQTAATYDDTAIKASIKANTDAIGVLNGDDTQIGSVKKQVADAVAKIVADAPEAYNTLKEISDWISSHASDASAMNSQINTNKNDISALKTLVGTLPDTAEATTIVGYIDEAVAALNIGDYAKAADLTAAIGRITTAEGKITTLEGKVSALEAVGAQANVIETVKVNGVALTPDAAKAVDVTVPTGALASKDKVAEADLAADLATKINAKAEKSDLDDLDTYVGTIPASATASNVIAYIDEKVAAEGVAALKTRVGNAETDIDNLQSDVATLKGADTVEGSVAKALKDAKAYTDALANGAVKTNTDAIATLNGTGEGSVAKAVSDGIAGLDVEDTAVAHQVVTAVSETDGKIAVTRAQLTTDDIAAGTEVWVFDCGTSSTNV